jgi:hypothetical protein
MREPEGLPDQRAVRDAFRDKDARGCIEGNGLPGYIEQDFAAEVLRGFRIAAPVKDNLIEIVNMLVNMGIRFGNIVNPAELYVIIDFRDLFAAHVSHCRTLAVFDPGSRFPKGLPDQVFFIVDIGHMISSPSCVLFEKLDIKTFFFIKQIHI